MKLTVQEYEDIRKMIACYKDTEVKLNDLQTRLYLLEEEKNKLLSEITNIKLEENNFFSDLEKKYGKGKFDIFSSEYIIENN